MSVGKTFWVRLMAALLAGSVAAGFTGVGAFAQDQNSSGAPASTDGQSTTKGVYGDWKLRCDSPPGSSTEQCIIQQSVVDDQSPDITLTVTMFKTADGKSRMMRVIAPLAVLLPSGLGLRIDQTDVGRVGFVRCLSRGCVAEVWVEDGLLEQLRTGQTATFIVFRTPEEGVGIPVSLSGFATAYDNLPNVSP